MFKFYVWKQDSFWGLSWNGAYLGKDISIWLGFQDSYSSNLQIVLRKRLTLSAASVFVTEGLFISCYLKKIIKIGFPELVKNFSNDFALFPEVIAYVLKFSCTKGFKDWTFLWYNSENSKWAGSKLASFHVCLHSFQCTPDQNNRFGKKYIDEKIYYWYGTVTFVYVFGIINLVCVQSVSVISVILGPPLAHCYTLFIFIIELLSYYKWAVRYFSTTKFVCSKWFTFRIATWSWYSVIHQRQDFCSTKICQGRFYEYTFGLVDPSEFWNK